MKSRKNRTNGIEILIAEDSPTQAEKLQHLLEEHGYAVTTAPDGKQALAAAQRRKPTLLISDIVMPEMDGYELCKAIKSDDALRDIPVILVTTLSDVMDIMKGLACGADNFIRKPYEDKYLLARVDYLLMNKEMRKGLKMQMGMEIHLGGQKHFITAERQQILDLLISVYEEAVHISEELKLRQRELADSNRSLTGLYHVAEGLNRAVNECEVCEKALEHALELPGVRAGWISLQEGGADFRLVAARGLPPALAAAGAMDGLCECRRRFLAGELDHVTNIMECERLQSATGDTDGLRYHASVPLWIGERMLGIMNLVGADQGLFKDDELEMLYGVGHQVGIALERARLHEGLERLVEERTAALTAEIVQRKQIEKKMRELAVIVEFSDDAIISMTPDGNILAWNRGAEHLYGYTAEEVRGQHFTFLVPQEHMDETMEIIARIGQGEHVEHYETIRLTKDGRRIFVNLTESPIRDETGAVVGIAKIARDITQHKADEAGIVRLNRIYSVLSGINTTIVRIRDQQELFKEACRIAVEHGKFIFAWIGMFDAGTQQITPVARAGHEDGYLDQINLTSIEDAPGNCRLTAEALTQVKPVICNDIAAEDRIENWRGEALKRGYRSLVVFPLTVESRPVGVFVLYAPETGVFDDEEMRLLSEMAGDISFALDNLEKEKRLNYLAYFDAITGLPNRALFLDRANQRIRAVHDGKKAFSVILLDPERFSSINETFGRQAGDDLLRQIASRLKETLDETYILARLAADNFIIATRGDDEGTGIAHVLETILSGIQNQPFLIGGQELRAATRAGIASYPADGEDIETLLRNAEAALKKAKLSGDKYLFYAPEFNARVAEKLSLENKLRRALEQYQLVLHYQPKVDLKSGQICGLEALLRWNDPETGLVPPIKFISLLEETGMILEAGRWALMQAVSDSRAWQAKGLRAPRIAVNVSPLQLQQKDFVSMVADAISDVGSEAVELELEITESLIMQDIEANIQKLKAIREMGVEVAIDDFGTGYSSLSYIAKLPVNTLKIDRAFIINMASNSDDLGIVSTIISLAHSLNLRVVAEGVETTEQASLLRLLKCNELQGFLFSQGVPAEQIETFLREKKSLPG
ncbi:MAG: EAL domain-containing protein [Rugosibacter sp.]|jgi:PAS domain S-box-containing protein/diguanylate cyclase (GGDEF)-like protein